MSPIEIEHYLKRMDPSRFSRITAQVIGTWIDHSGPQPVWRASVLDRAACSNLPRAASATPGILSGHPDIIKMIIDDLKALRTVGVPLDTMCCCGVIIAHLKISCPAVFEHVVKDGSHFWCTEAWVKKFLSRNLNWTFC
ncbi:hypothetical protein PAXINDRAFT_87222 [Paxillus involutus ATCC 200175]|uniref:Uncharacterized protein n=1 Tax=Paxillus involutus ATCC 200175 TaxID=664439 RepID=A0A0C9SQG5_PAXIN|nr:hypothetical protein PAXINDRAFT_87222 [Paxillus involutus ATCC 200175]